MNQNEGKRESGAEVGRRTSGRDGSVAVQCIACQYFQYFDNTKGHNSPHALGKCLSEPWDGNHGQWAALHHPCKNFVKREADPAQDDTG